MANATTARPQKVTMACLAAGVASAIVLVSIVSTLSNWGSIEVREQIEDALAAGPADGAISVDQALGWLRGVLMGAGALSAAAIVLAIWTAKRHRGARIGLTVLAVLSSLAFLVAGAAGIVPALLGVMVVVFLWGRESRAWFAGEAPAETTSQQRRPVDPPGPPTPVLPTSQTQAPPPSVRAPDPAASGGQPAPAARPYASGPEAVSQPFSPQSAQYGPGANPAPYGRMPVPGRPRPLVTAVVVAAALSGLAAAVFGLNVLLYLASPGQYADLIAEQPMIADSDILGQLGMTAAELARTMFWLSLALALLAVAGAVSALAMLSRRPATRIVFTVVAALGMVASVLTAPLGLVWLLAEVACVVLVWRREVSDWFRAARR
ncbi:hypothetical protein KV102_05095 [Mumia sp. zg.B53]|uniref:hypothetical protein n=1 Tax=Mumia sp. zg.B53 TaxID=2855449 RepID=UPI001C6DDB01|nr:hypothetical protein [Mumia sp. zg.B53]MBW9214212.1 hypothetical protein [Mumia sp. zg.B53]